MCKYEKLFLDLLGCFIESLWLLIQIWKNPTLNMKGRLVTSQWSWALALFRRQMSCRHKEPLNTFNCLAFFEGDCLPPRWQDQISTDNQAMVLYIPCWGLWSSCGLWESQWYLTLFSAHMLQKIKRAIAADTLQTSVKWDNCAFR